MGIGLYIHVPFCRTRCHFCAFYLRIHREDQAQMYMESLAREIQLSATRNSLGGRRLDSVYLGGGTPTTLRPEQLCTMLGLARNYLGVQEGAEVTVEAHPDSVTLEGLRRLDCAGFNRISFGVQSLDDGELVRLGRRTPSESARAAVALARAAGFVNINLDLMYGLPGQTLESWRSTLEQAIALEPTHLSCYALTVEDGTRLQKDIGRGDRTEPNAVLQNAMEDDAVCRLAKAGFERYEISNFCRAGYACRHNLHYWRGEDYLGLGPSAQSYLNGRRFGNAEDLEAYHRALEAGRAPVAESAHLSPEQRRREAVVFGLRLIEGIDLAALRSGPRDREVEDEWQHALHRLRDQGLVEERTGWIRLTDLGRRFADSVAVELM
ncbi:MAG: radical SAM family heme chaperone HemW [Nitrospiraceae bacterium]